ncbi:MAG: hypothetical protein Q7T07_14495 [Burkholderiaceae bacterium]|nr:hypothetical protein [Burkholderiaceae bacterium]
MRNHFLNATILIATYAMSTRANIAFAHDGHGLAGTHWHATDVWGFVVVGGLAAVAIWVSRKNK